MTNGLRNSPTGSKNRYHEVLATKLVIANTGAMLIVGHEAPFRISALACRIESPEHTGKAENSRQVSGTSDASKTQSMLIANPANRLVPTRCRLNAPLLGSGHLGITKASSGDSGPYRYSSRSLAQTFS